MELTSTTDLSGLEVRPQSPSPDSSPAQVRAAALLAGVDAHYAKEQKAADQLESARRIAVALEQRIEEIRLLHHNGDGDGFCHACCFCWPCETVLLIDAELEVDC